ncbi:MAG: hypothetical protein ABIH23_18555 [bacterium]
MVDIVSPYNALNGHELKKIVLREVERAMDNSGIFHISRTFPVVDWNWTLKIKAYPQEPAEDEVGVSRHEAVGPVPDHGQSVEEELKGGREEVGKAVAPNAVRTEEDLPVPKPQERPGIGIVDSILGAVGPKKM